MRNEFSNEISQETKKHSLQLASLNMYLPFLVWKDRAILCIFDHIPLFLSHILLITWYYNFQHLQLTKTSEMINFSQKLHLLNFCIIILSTLIGRPFQCTVNFNKLLFNWILSKFIIFESWVLTIVAKWTVGGISSSHYCISKLGTMRLNNCHSCSWQN